MISYKIPEGAGHTLAPKFMGYCSHCRGYQWSDWYSIRLKDDTAHEFAVCLECGQMSERDRYFISLVNGTK